MAEEKMKSANKQKLTAMEKNKLAIMYMEMRQDFDIRTSLCDKYKVDPKNIQSLKTKAQKKAEKAIKEMEVAYNSRKEKSASPRKLLSQSNSSPATVSPDRSVTMLSKVE